MRKKTTTLFICLYIHITILHLSIHKLFYLLGIGTLHYSSIHFQHLIQSSRVDSQHIIEIQEAPESSTIDSLPSTSCPDSLNLQTTGPSRKLLQIFIFLLPHQNSSLPFRCYQELIYITVLVSIFCLLNKLKGICKSVSLS